MTASPDVPKGVRETIYRELNRLREEQGEQATIGIARRIAHDYSMSLEQAANIMADWRRGEERIGGTRKEITMPEDDNEPVRPSDITGVDTNRPDPMELWEPPKDLRYKLPKDARLEPGSYDPGHKPLACTVCGYERRFVGYGLKQGKDGRQAKWPVYETCPNLDRAGKHPSRSTTVEYLRYEEGPKEPVDVFTEPMQVRRPGAPNRRSTVSGNLYQLPPGASLEDKVQELVEHYAEKYGKTPENLYLHPEDAESWGVEPGTRWAVNVQYMDHLTPGYRYVLLS